MAAHAGHDVMAEFGEKPNLSENGVNEAWRRPEKAPFGGQRADAHDMLI